MRRVARANRTQVFATRADPTPAADARLFARFGSANERGKHAADAQYQRDHRLDIRGRTSAERASYLQRGSALTGFAAGDAVGAALVAGALSRRAFGGIERGTRRALSGLLPELWVAEADAGDEPDQLQAKLVGDQSVMGKLWGPCPSAKTATGCEFVRVPAPQPPDLRPRSFHHSSLVPSGPIINQG